MTRTPSLNPSEGAAAFDLKCVSGYWVFDDVSLELIEVSSKKSNLTDKGSADNEVNTEEIEVENRNSEGEVRQKRKCSKSGWRDKDFLFQIEFMGQWNCSQKNLLDYENDNDVDILCKFSNNQSPTVSQEIIIQLRFTALISGLVPLRYFQDVETRLVVLKMNISVRICQTQQKGFEIVSVKVF